MHRKDLRALAIIAGVLAFAAVGLAQGASAKPVSAPAYKLANVGPFGGEPTIAANLKGELYDTTPSGGTLLYKSTNHGATWTQATTADPSSGDDCVTTDQSGALYECNLAGSVETAPLQADVWKSVNDGKTWMYGNNNVDLAGGSNVCGTSCNPFGVDRQWTAASLVKSAGLAKRKTLTLKLQFARCRAITRPSPPLLPLPQQTTTGP